MELLLLWIASVVGCGFLAKNKGRSVGGWVVAGLFFGVFALIALAIMKSKHLGFVPKPPSSFPGSYGAPGSPPPGQYGAPQE
jgi:hypothetical protein